MDRAAFSSLRLARREVTKRLIRNVLVVLSGNGVVLALGLASLSLNARALGPGGMGILGLLLASADVVGQIFAFQTWQPLITIGASAYSDRNFEKLANVIALAFVYDVAAAFLSAGVGSFLVLFWGEWIGLPPGILPAAALFMLSRFFVIRGASVGVLRLLDLFHWLSITNVGLAAVRLASALVLFGLGCSLGYYVIAFAIFAVLDSFAVGALALAALRRNAIPLQISGIRRAWQEDGRLFWSFSWATSIVSSINAVRKKADLFLVGALLGVEGAGVYVIAQRLADLMRRIADPVQQVIYPELARLAASRQRSQIPYHVLASGATCGLVGLAGILLTLAGGEHAVALAAGEQYDGADAPLFFLMTSIMIAMCGVGLRPALLSTAGPISLLTSYAVSFAIFCAVAPVTITTFGIAGAGISQVVFNAVWFISLSLALYRWNGSAGNNSAY